MPERGPEDGGRPVRQAVVNRIIPFSSVDGPGNRTAIFLQGCNLNCLYCHNPETRSRCRACGLCVPACPAGALRVLETEPGAPMQISYDPALCLQCDTCIHACPHGSSPRTRVMTPNQVMEAVRRQIPFIRGITVSGGECMLSPLWLTDLFGLAKAQGLGALIDTNGTIPFQGLENLLDVTDGVMLDIKAFSEESHRRVTGSGNREVLENARFLAERGKLYEVRCVIVPDLYDAVSSVSRMGAFLLPVYQAGPFRVKLIRYRPMGVRKEYAYFRIPSLAEMEELEGILRKMGYRDVVRV